MYSQLLGSVQKILDGETVLECAIGKKCVAIATERGIGMAFTTGSAWEIILRQGIQDIRAMESAMRGYPLSLLVPRYLENDPLQCVLSLAAMNSLLIASGEYSDEDWTESLQYGQKLAMVGYFTPLLKRLRERGIEPLIFELLPLPGTIPPERAAELMPQCDAVLITGSTFANKSIHHYLPHIHPEAEAWILGPSTPLADFLLSRFTLGSSIVRDQQAVFNAIRSGAGMHSLKRAMYQVIRKRKRTIQ